MNSASGHRDAALCTAGSAAATPGPCRAWRFVAAVVAAAGLLGCSSSSDGSSAVSGTRDNSNTILAGDTDDPATNTTYGGDTAGTVTLSSSTITGQADRMLVIIATSTGQGSQAGVVCAPITSDEFQMPSTMLTAVPEGQNPCAGGTDVAVLADGAYTITAGVYVPGSQQPEAQLMVDVVMDGGAVSVELAGAALSAS